MSAALGLGTVQFGTDYGVANLDGHVPVDVVSQILLEARRRGVSVLDTAALYGESEEVLGGQDLDGFQLITKTPRFAAAQITREMGAELLATFERSLRRLRRPLVDGLLSHHIDDLLAPGGEYLWRAMQSLKDQRLTKWIGASVYDGAQIDALLERFEPDLVQLPMNVLDQRLIEGGQIRRLQQRGVRIHARSVFLQGLLLMPIDEVASYFNPIYPILRRWHQAAAEQGMTLVQAALAFVRDVPGIDVVLVGVNGLRQFVQCADDFAVAGAFDATGLACKDCAYLDPSRWILT